MYGSGSAFLKDLLVWTRVQILILNLRKCVISLWYFHTEHWRRGRRLSAWNFESGKVQKHDNIVYDLSRSVWKLFLSRCLQTPISTSVWTENGIVKIYQKSERSSNRFSNELRFVQEVCAGTNLGLYRRTWIELSVLETSGASPWVVACKSRLRHQEQNENGLGQSLPKAKRGVRTDFRTN